MATTPTLVPPPSDDPAIPFWIRPNLIITNGRDPLGLDAISTYRIMPLYSRESWSSAGGPIFPDSSPTWSRPSPTDTQPVIWLLSKDSSLNQSTNTDTPHSCAPDAPTSRADALAFWAKLLSVQPGGSTESINTRAVGRDPIRWIWPVLSASNGVPGCTCCRRHDA